MIPQFELIYTASALIISTLFGNRLAMLSLQVIAQTTDSVPTDITKILTGQGGAIGGMVIAVLWLSKRLNKVEEKHEEREKERDEDRKTLILTLAKTNEVIETNTEVCGSVKDTLNKVNENLEK